MGYLNLRLQIPSFVCNAIWNSRMKGCLQSPKIFHIFIGHDCSDWPTTLAIFREASGHLIAEVTHKIPVGPPEWRRARQPEGPVHLVSLPILGHLFKHPVDGFLVVTVEDRANYRTRCLRAITGLAVGVVYEPEVQIQASLVDIAMKYLVIEDGPM